MNLIISKSYDIAILKSSGLKSLGEFLKNIRDVILSQGRNGDYNIGERIGYAEEILNSKKLLNFATIFHRGL